MEIIRAAIERHQGDELALCYRLLGIRDLLVILEAHGLLDDTNALMLAASAHELWRKTALKLCQPTDAAARQTTPGGDE